MASFTDASGNTFSTFYKVTIQNNQSTALLSTSPVRLSVNPFPNVNSDWSNVAFTLVNGSTYTEIYSWVESEGTPSVIWIKLPNGISANSSVIVYIWVGSTSYTYDSYRGIAPQLSSSYAANDTGASVFPFYDNFAGTTFDTTKWQAVASGSVSQNNGLTISCGNSQYVNVLSKNTNAYPMIFEELAHAPNVTAGEPAYNFAGEALSTSNSGTYLGVGADSSYETNSAATLIVYDSAGSGTGIGNTGTGTLPAIYGILWLADGSEYSFVNDEIMGTATDTSLSIADYYYYLGGFGTGGAGSGSSFFQYARARSPPPNNVSPTIVYPSTYTVTFTESGLTSGTSWSVTLNGVANSSTTDSISFTEYNGTYAYSVANITGYTVSPASGNVTVNGANITVSIVFTAIPKYTITFSQTGLISGKTFGVTFNGVLQSNTTGDAISFTDYAGTYSYSVSAVTHLNVSPSSGTVDLTSNIDITIHFSSIPISNALITAVPNKSGYPTLSAYTDGNGAVTLKLYKAITYTIRMSGPVVGTATISPANTSFTLFALKNNGKNSIYLSGQKLKPSSSIFALKGPIPVKQSNAYFKSWKPSKYFKEPTARSTLLIMNSSDIEVSVNVLSILLYAVDGSNGGAMATNNAYDPSTNTWTAKTTDPTARVGPAAGIIGSKLYVVDGNSFNALNHAYDPSTNTWSARAPGRNAGAGPFDLAAGVIKSRLYAVDGSVGSNTVTDGVWSYNPSFNDWSVRANDLNARAALAAVVIDSKLYAVDGNSRNTSNNAYDPSTNTWSARAHDITGRSGVAAGIIGSKLYVVDGGLGGGSGIGNNNAYDPSTNTWTAKASDLGPRFTLAAGVINSLLYAVDGYHNGYVAVNHVYDPSTDTWTAKASDLVARRRLTAGVVG